VRHAFGKTLLGAFGTLELVGGAEPAAATVARQLVLVALATPPLLIPSKKIAPVLGGKTAPV
jgi:hypothetical protein